jgi:thiol-disulfide isomerase/thioredoxin
MSVNAYADPAGQKNVIKGKKGPTFKGIDFNDKEFDLNLYYEKKPIVLNFFSVHCVSCLTAVNTLEKYRGKNNIADEIIFIYICLDDWKSEVHIPSVWKKIFNKNPIRINDGERKIGKLYEVVTLPATVILDATGMIYYRRDDYNMDFEKEINQRLGSLLK